MSDRIHNYAAKLRLVTDALDAIEQMMSLAEGVMSSLGSTGGGGSSDIESRYIALSETADRLRHSFEVLDDERQFIMECIDMVPSERERGILTACMRDVQVHGCLIRARVARHLGIDKSNFYGQYDSAIQSLNRVMREHHAD